MMNRKTLYKNKAVKKWSMKRKMTVGAVAATMVFGVGAFADTTGVATISPSAAANGAYTKSVQFLEQSVTALTSALTLSNQNLVREKQQHQQDVLKGNDNLNTVQQNFAAAAVGSGTQVEVDNASKALTNANNANNYNAKNDGSVNSTSTITGNVDTTQNYVAPTAPSTNNSVAAANAASAATN
ncbi:hypothetical protein [Fructobacillus ficulneus]|uniref:Uncharacterized protein n=1 Tax=Fructobacillus ficulneus TaxID=157463 RepID=A0A0K8MIJ7_9LACO|nr:hypothetical protein [Fructobacillus ficulneus]GAO99704.1 hypothetical protein FFIC_231910 [Fructobacillus ficulneus]